ncbi:MAG TPA: nuclear transport factor 2 family protein [Chryseosolibacter sp.]
MIVFRLTFVIVLLSKAGAIMAQPASLLEVIKAEKEFARYSADHNTRDAFVNYMADDGILFHKNEPVNGKQLWSSRPADNTSLLFWWPQYADVSADGTLGYTTGPWYAKQDRSSNAVTAYGFYTSVWKKEYSGEWKVVLDISIPLPGGLQSSDTVVAWPAKRNEVRNADSAEIALLLDSVYNDELGASRKSFLAKYFSGESRIHRRERWPYTSADQYHSISETISAIRFKQRSRDIRSAQGLTYTYGNAFITDETGKEKVLKYFRIWKLERGQWKIVLDVLA